MIFPVPAKYAGEPRVVVRRTRDGRHFLAVEDHPQWWRCGHHKSCHPFEGDALGVCRNHGSYCNCAGFKSQLDDIAETVARRAQPVIRGGLDLFGGKR